MPRKRKKPGDRAQVVSITIQPALLKNCKPKVVKEHNDNFSKYVSHLIEKDLEKDA